MKKRYTLGLLAATAASTTIMTAPHSYAASASPPDSKERHATSIQRLQRETDLLGLSAAELQSRLKTESFWQIAQEQGVPRETLQQKRDARLAAKLKAKGFSSAQIEQQLMRVEQRKGRWK